MDIDSLYDWSCKKLNILIPRNKISEILFEKVLSLRSETSVNGRRLNSYSQEFQNLNTLEQWIKLLINFYESIPEPHPSENIFEGQNFILPKEKTCKVLLSQYRHIHKQLS